MINGHHDKQGVSYVQTHSETRHLMAHFASCQPKDLTGKRAWHGIAERNFAAKPKEIICNCWGIRTLSSLITYLNIHLSFLRTASIYISIYMYIYIDTYKSLWYHVSFFDLAHTIFVLLGKTQLLKLLHTCVTIQNRVEICLLFFFFCGVNPQSGHGQVEDFMCVLLLLAYIGWSYVSRCREKTTTWQVF